MGIGEYEDEIRYEHEFCLPPNTTFTFVAYDYWGDGWNGGYLFHFYNNKLFYTQIG